MRTVAAIGLIGVATGLGAFDLTAMHQPHLYIGPLCAVDDHSPAFDPWTGLPSGRTFVMQCDASLQQTGEGPLVIDPVPPDMVGRRAIPVPVGFAVGVAISTAVAIWRARRRTPTQVPPEALPRWLDVVVSASLAASLVILSLVVQFATMVAIIAGIAIVTLSPRWLRRSLAGLGIPIDDITIPGAIAWLGFAVGFGLALLFFGSLSGIVVIAAATGAIALLHRPERNIQTSVDPALKA
jgi:hypothetical protein